MNMVTVESIRSFIRENMVSNHRNAALGDDDDIFKLGFVSSMTALKLVNFVETECGVTVDNDDLDVSTFSTVNRIVAFIERKLGTTLSR
ncbi:phosphopantetheine-binding protein [Polyangium sp. y55x31]|uniref:acyl carrier protein n=1 Tax=Polyangium sp. y55x31 TaxID=3042688 RepID=UPI002482FDBA|nr:phosphopantetheine-binding protein [Polyangium sp. y55x31]MDI1475022.1 phosphopantetheine-binding protein [Polyangium sp. y55x31]